MKIIMKYFLVFFAAGIFGSCEKKITTITVEGAMPPVLTANRSTINISFATKDEEAVKLMWTNPDYKFSTGPNSQDVAYLVEIDTAGAGFTNPSRKTISINKDLALTITQTELNDYLLNQLNLRAEVPHNIEIHVVASLKNNALPLSSNVLKYTVIPYTIPPKVAPPASGRLFIVGNATPGGWNNPVPAPAQEFTRVSATLYTITLALTGGNSYLLLPVNGSWDIKYGGAGANNANNVNEDDFKLGGGDILAPATSGNYKIDVDFQRGKFKLTKL